MMHTTTRDQVRTASGTLHQARRGRRRRAGLRAVGVLGVGHYVPETVLSNAALEEIVDTSDEWIRTRTGMRERRCASREQATSDLAVLAGRAAIADAGLEPRDIDLILVATVSPDHLVPPTATLVQHRLGAVHAAGFDVGAACSGFVNALAIGKQFVATGTYRRVLVIGAEKMTTLVDYQDRESCVLFGDGAGAVVLGAEGDGEILDIELGVDGSGADMITVPAGGSRLPASVETLAGRQHFLTMQGRGVFRFAVDKISALVEELTSRNGLSLDDLAWIVPHQANQRILEAAARRLGVSMEKVVSNVDRFGNTSSASIPIALSEAAADGRLRRGDLVVVVGFGAGLTWGAALLRW